MTNVRTIHVDWYSQRPPRFSGGPQLAYQGDHLSNMVVFDNAPELPNYYLLVEMKTDDAGPVVALPGIQLEGPYWVIPNYYTQICQQITYQVCCKTESGDFEHHSAKFKGTILPVIKHNGEPIDQSPMFDPYIDILNKRVDELIVAAGDIQIDSELKSDSGNPVQNRVIKAKIDEIDENAIALNGRLVTLKDHVYTETASANLLYLDAVTPNVYINNNNGNEATYNNWGATDYMPVVGGQEYAFVGCYSTAGTYEYIRTDYYAFYDANKEYISGGFNSRGPITIPSNAKYIRESTNLQAFTGQMYKTMFGLLSDLTEYIGQKTNVDYIIPQTVVRAAVFLTNAIKNTTGRTITVEKDGTGDYSTLKEAVEYSEGHADTTILVGAGTYDLIEEFGSDYFVNLSASDLLGERHGLQIGNGVHIIFSSGAKVTAHYTGTNTAVNKNFSPFNFAQGTKGFILENLTLEASNVRYCVHDEAGSTRTPKAYKNVYKNCRMQIDNSQNTVWTKHQCIGGGLGIHGEIIIEDCIFIDLYNINYRVGVVTYHNAVSEGAKSRLVVRGNWFSDNGTFRLSWYGASTEITEALVTNNSMTHEPYASAESSSYETENVQMLAWNNVIRTA